MKNRSEGMGAIICQTPDGPVVAAFERGGTAKAAGIQCYGLTLSQARRLLCAAYPQEWDVIELCCGGDPYARCPRGLVAALAELNDEPVSTVYARLSRARARLRAWTGDPAQAAEAARAAAAPAGATWA